MTVSGAYVVKNNSFGTTSHWFRPTRLGWPNPLEINKIKAEQSVETV